MYGRKKTRHFDGQKKKYKNKATKEGNEKRKNFSGKFTALATFLLFARAIAPLSSILNEM